MHSIATFLLLCCLAVSLAEHPKLSVKNPSGAAAAYQLGPGALICFKDTAERFTQAAAVPKFHPDGESVSCFSYTCTAQGISSGECQTQFSHGWELTSTCNARKDSPAFADVKCCTDNGCNAANDTKPWSYVGPADNTAHISCYFSTLPGSNPNEAYSVVYGSWSGIPDTPREVACLRYQKKHLQTGAPLDSWAYFAIDLAACDLKTGKPFGNVYASVAVETTVMCCVEPDCNAPDPSLDTTTKAGPTIAQALLQEELVQVKII